MYREGGLLAQPGPIPFVGSVRFFASPSPDTTLVLVSLAMANRSFLFSPESGANRATFTVALTARDSGRVAAEVHDRQMIRVATYKETTRSDASVIFQRYLALAPGTYTIAADVRDQA
jgi:hypothetical protein